MVYFVTKTTAEYSNFQLGENYRFALFCACQEIQIYTTFLAELSVSTHGIDSNFLIHANINNNIHQSRKKTF